MLQNVQATDPLANLTYETLYQPPRCSTRTSIITSASRPIASTQATASETATSATLCGASAETTTVALPIGPTQEGPKGILTPKKSKKGPKPTVTFAGMLIVYFVGMLTFFPWYFPTFIIST